MIETTDTTKFSLNPSTTIVNAIFETIIHFIGHNTIDGIIDVWLETSSRYDILNEDLYDMDEALYVD